MPKSRKLADEKPAGYTKEELEKMKQAEESIKCGKEHLKKPPKALRDGIAKKEWNRIVQQFEKVDVVGNLDLANILGYCNAFSNYVEITEELKGQPHIVELVKNGFKVKGENPLIKLQEKYAKEMREFEKCIGLTLGSRLKAGEANVNNTQKQIEEDFGDI